MGGWGSRVLNFLVKIYAMFIWYIRPFYKYYFFHEMKLGNLNPLGGREGSV